MEKSSDRAHTQGLSQQSCQSSAHTVRLSPRKDSKEHQGKIQAPGKLVRGSGRQNPQGKGKTQKEQPGQDIIRTVKGRIRSVPGLTGSQSSMVRPSVSSAPASRASRRTSAMTRGETAASVSASTRLRAVRSSSKTDKSPNKTPPAAPPAMAGLARYMESMVSAEAG